MNQPLEALISAKAKKISKPFITSKAHSNLQGVFPTMIGFVTLGHCLFMDHAKKVAKGAKANHGWENTPAINFCVPLNELMFLTLADIKALSG